MGKTSNLSTIHPLHPHKKSGFRSRHGQTVTNPVAGPVVLKCQYQPTCCPGKASDEKHHSSRDVCYDNIFRPIAANSAPRTQEMAGNLKFTQGCRRLCTWPDSATSDSFIALVSFLSAKLEQ